MACSHRALYVVLSFTITFMLCAAEPETCRKAGGKGCAGEEGDTSVFLQGVAQASNNDAMAEGLGDKKQQAHTPSRESGKHPSRVLETKKEAPTWKRLTTTCQNCIRTDWIAIHKDAKPVFDKCVKSCSTKGFLPSTSSFHDCKLNCRKQARSSLPTFLHCAACVRATSTTLLLLDVPEEVKLGDDEASGAAFLDSLEEGNEYDSEEVEEKTESDADEADSATMEESVDGEDEYDTENMDSGAEEEVAEEENSGDATEIQQGEDQEVAQDQNNADVFQGDDNADGENESEQEDGDTNEDEREEVDSAAEEADNEEATALEESSNDRDDKFVETRDV